MLYFILIKMEQIKTYGQLKEHLLAVMDYADDDKECKMNRSISKGKYWNMLMDCCIKKDDSEIVGDIVVKNTLTEFPDYLRCDFVV